MNIFKMKQSLILLAVILLVNTMDGYSQKTRDEISDKYKWNLTDLFPNEEAWRDALNNIKGRLNEVESFKGTLTKSAANLLKALEYNSEISKAASKLSSYASMNSDLDTRNMKYSAMKQELQQLFASFGAKSAFMDPEILSADWETIDGFIKQEPKLEVYRKGLTNMFKNKKHSLSEPEERIMALSRLATGVAGSVYGTFADAEMPNAEITLSNGSKVKLSSSEFSKIRASENRKDRETASKAYWDNYAKFKATYGELLNGKVNGDVYRFRARNYTSSLEASLDPNNIPVEVYQSLIDNVNKNLPSFHRYLSIKKRIMQLDTLKYSDIYAPVVKDLNLKYNYEEATKLVLEALKPMGSEYVSTVQKAISERWIDVFATPGKQRGAYSNGADFDGHPYILLNYTDQYNDVSTLAHELGHTMHSYFSNKTQPFQLSRYETFVAEVASTFNEVLLFNYMIGTVKDDDVKLSILMNWLDNFKGTLFRQTQFAEFELKIHQIAEQGKPLTGETFSKLYKEITDKYYGNAQGICKVDDYISMEWAAIPHFYRTFYVYQYSTSFTASISLAEKVLSGDKTALQNYMKFLSSGGSDYPIEILKKAGIDMTTSEPLEKTTQAMNKVMDEIEKILDKKKK